MLLGLWGKFCILALGGLVVIVAVIVVACFIGPGCWGFEYLRRGEKKEKFLVEKTSMQVNNNGNGIREFNWLDSNDYAFYQTGLQFLKEKTFKTVSSQLSKEKIFNLKCAPLLSAPNFTSMAKSSTPKLELKIHFFDSFKNDVPCRLTIHLIVVTNLPYREYAPTLDPYLTIEILINKWLQKNERIVHMVQTNIVKNSTNPVFEQTFSFDVKKGEIKVNWCLKLTLMDNDNLTKSTPLFDKRLYLRDLKNLMADAWLPLTLDMQEVIPNIGELLFGISYLPTAQRLHISVFKANKLKNLGFINSFDLYVSIMMVNNRGTCLKKKKTQFISWESCPIFNQSLVFDLSISNLEQTVFLVLLCFKCLQKEANATDPSFETNSSLKQTKDKVLGAVVLGKNVRCTRARDHWVAVMQNPRQMITVWHELR